MGVVAGYAPTLLSSYIFKSGGALMKTILCLKHFPTSHQLPLSSRGCVFFLRAYSSYNEHLSNGMRSHLQLHLLTFLVGSPRTFYLIPSI